MHNIKKITNDLYWVGANDRRLFMFEGVYSVPNGVSYNSYLLLDDKVVLFDTVDKAVEEQFFENIEYVLQGRKIDFMVIHHMEPDHSASIGEILRRYPEITVICNALTKKMILQFFNISEDTKFLVVNEGDVFETGHHKFTFVNAPMVHWPEVMVSYDLEEKMLFSADAFGTFGALNGAIFADELDFFRDYVDEARRYYTNIVGKYGPQVQNILEKASKLEIRMILPLHGPIWREKINMFIDLYDKWSKYIPEEKGVLIAYASVYGHTENVAEILSSKLRNLGVKTVMYDTSVIDSSYIVSEAFKYSHLVFASTTYNMGIFIKMDETLRDLVAHNIQNRTIAFIENGSWAPTSKSLMKGLFKTCKSIKYIEKELTILSSLKHNQLDDLDEMALQIKESMNLEDVKAGNKEQINFDAMYKLSYGLYLVTTKDGEKANGCIINTAQMVTESPAQISFTINKANHTADMILKTKTFNLYTLSENAPFDVIKHFGFQSGRDVNKFNGDNRFLIDAEGNLKDDYFPPIFNSYIKGEVNQAIDLGTHYMFIGGVKEAKLISDKPSMTYQYYFDHVKPSINLLPASTNQYACKICGFVYEGDEVPDDYICPLCKHGKDAFVKI